MTEPTDDEIAFFARAEGIKVRTGAGAVKLVRAALAKWGQPAQATEPVAWAFKYDDGTWHDPSTTEHSPGMRPLCAAPQPVVREPLSANQVSGLAESAGYWHGDMSRADFINGIRYAEAAHGITQKGGQHGTE